jgi:hypothetical protein
MTIEELVQKEHEAGVQFGPFHRQWLMQRAPKTVRRDLEMAARFPNLVAARQGFASMDVNDANTAAFGAVASTAAEANIVGATQGLINQFCAIPANDARAGKVYEVRFGGIYSNTGTPTMIWTPRWGNSTTVATNVTLGASPTVTTITGTTNLAVYGEFLCTIRTAPPGATAGTAYGTGLVAMQIPVTSSQNSMDITLGNTSGAIDTTGQGTAGCGLTINLTWSASSASNTFTCQWFLLRSLN